MSLDEEPLGMWTIYDHPRDYPSGFVARRFEVTEHGSRPTMEAWVADNIEQLRGTFRKFGMVCLPRNPNDDPVIVETWL